ncbi:pentatricopeptide repeat-containing protein At1g62930, chloroplastic-like [Pyrus communis]|uniref:pentatricopeptide repeat-containing protein At1g62930, chloroplastic-like n=1 Tax=Pyrus communis TaxID=23211 RepID=UPI0035C1DA96
MGAVQVFVEMPNSKVSCEVFVVALTELLRDQLKTKRTLSRSLSKVQQPFGSRFMDDLLAFLDGSEVTSSECIICVVIHNIDGLGLRESEIQQCLARVVSCFHICIVASIDHVNAPFLKDKGLTPDAYSYDPLVSAFCKEGRLDLVIEFLDYMILDSCLPDIVNYTMILAALCKSGKAYQALQLFENLGEVGCPSNVSSYNTMFSALWNCGDRVRALQMVLEMAEAKLNEIVDGLTANVDLQKQRGPYVHAESLQRKPVGLHIAITAATVMAGTLGGAQSKCYRDAQIPYGFHYCSYEDQVDVSNWMKWNCKIADGSTLCSVLWFRSSDCRCSSDLKLGFPS